MQRFEFIDVNDPQARQKAGKHAARHSQAIRKERLVDKRELQERLGPDSTLSLALPRASLPHGRPQPLKVTQPDGLHEDGEHGQPTNGQATSKGVGTVSAPEVTDHGLIQASSAGVSANPTLQKTSLGAFGDLLSQLNQVDDQLCNAVSRKLCLPVTGVSNGGLFRGCILTCVHEVFTRLPALVWHVTDASPINPCRDWFFACVAAGPLGLHASLLFGIIYSHPHYGGDAPTNVLKQKIRLFSMMNTALQRPAPAYSDDLIFAIASLAIVEDRLGNAKACHMHWSAVEKAIHLRGGFESLRNNEGLCGALAWLEITIAYRNVRLTPAHKPSPNQEAKSSSGTAERRKDGESSFQWFLVMLQMQIYSSRSVSRRSSKSARVNLLAVAKPMYAMLSPEFGFPGPYSKLVDVNRRCQLACLLYINYVLAEFQQSDLLGNEFIRHVSIFIARYNIDIDSGAKVLFFALMREFQSSNMKSFCFVIRAMRVIRQLSEETTTLVHTVLLRQLRLTSEKETSQQLRDIEDLLAML